MGKTRRSEKHKSQTLPSSPSHSSSSSDFEFTISISPRKASSALCPADELFYKGQLLPLHLSPRLSLVRTLAAATATSTATSRDSSATANTTTSASSRDSSSSSDSSSFSGDLNYFLCDSSRPSSVSDEAEDLLKKINPRIDSAAENQADPEGGRIWKRQGKYFSLSRFSSVFKKEPKNADANGAHVPVAASPVKRASSTAREVIRKYLKKVKPLYEKISQKQQQQKAPVVSKTDIKSAKETVFPVKNINGDNNCGKGSANTASGGFSVSFSGNLKYPRKNRCVSSCPSSMRSSPSHSGVLSRSGFLSLGLGPDPNSSASGPGPSRAGGMYRHSSDAASSMEELQSAIQGAIAHCKNSLLQNKISSEI